jgi:hypothetical protein
LYQFGQAGLDMPVPADYTGSGRTEVAVYRPTTSQWFALSPGGGSLVVAEYFGAPGDQPVPADYEGIGKADIAVYRPATSQWFINRANGTVGAQMFGQSNVDVPVPGDYEGTGRADVAVFRPTTGEWFIE